MSKYIGESLHILSLSLLIFVFPHLALAGGDSFQNIIDKKIANMTLDEKVGQLFIIGFPQKDISKDLEKFISDYKPGAFLLFKRNIASVDQVKNLTASLYRVSFKFTKLPPLIAIDQEGGSVSRLPIFPAPPNALAIGQTQSPLLAEEMGYQTGLFLREVGFNMNLAPVLDIADPFNSSFIGVRSFGSDPDMVSELGVAYSKGLLKARVVPTAKHFPGVGNLTADPHLTIAQNNSSVASLKAIDLKPYDAYSKLGSNIAIMLSHLIYPAFDSSNEPASFSKKISHDLLRNEINYSGLVITDDLQMQGSKQLLRPEAAALKALQAGADIVMLTWSFADQAKAFAHVKEGIENGELSSEELTAKLQRILKAKAFVNLYRRRQDLPPLLKGLSLSSKDYDEVTNNILEHNLKVNLIPKELPQKTSAISRKASSISKLCILTASRSFISSFRESSETSSKEISSKILTKKTLTKQMMNWAAHIKCPIAIVAVTGPRTAALVKSLPLRFKKRVIVVNLGAPTLMGKPNGYYRVLQLYFNHRDAGKKVAQHFTEILESGEANSYVSR